MRKIQLLVMFLASLPCTSVHGAKPSPTPCVVEAGADCAFTLSVDGRSREYLLHVPDGYDGTPVPLVVDVHGYTSTPESQRSNSGMYELSDIETFAVAYPRGGAGSRPKWWERGFNGSADWVDPGCCATPAEENWDDVALMVAVKQDVTARMNVDRFYFTGLSNGSYMGHRLLCEAPDTFDAYATTSAALSESWRDCTPSSTRPVLYMHGRNDTVQPIEGSLVAGEMMLSTADTMDIYATRNGCVGYPSSYVETFSSGASWCREYDECDESVAYCELDAPHVTYGATPLDVAEIFWDFFSRH